MKLLGFELTVERRQFAPSNDFWYSRFPYLPGSPVNANEYTVEGIPAVWGAINMIVGTMISMPLILYRNLSDDEGKERAKEDPVYELLHDSPNHAMTAADFKTVMQRSLLLRGVAYAYVDRSTRQINALWPLNPDRVTVDLDNTTKSLVYTVRDNKGQKYKVPDNEMLRILGHTRDGINGCSVIETLREAFERNLGLQEHQKNLFENGARLSGLLKYPGTLKPEARKNLRESWDKTYSGSANSFKTAILEEGIDFSPLTMNQSDAQFVETANLTSRDIALAFNIPPHKIRDLSNATFSNIEMQSLEYIQDTIMPWAKRWEEAIKRDLLFLTAQDDLFVEFLVDSQIRGDIQTRYNAYATARNWGWMSVNDIRRLENMNPVKNGDIYLQPLNMVEAGLPPPQQATATIQKPAITDTSAAQDDTNVTDTSTDTTPARTQRRGFLGVSFAETLVSARSSFRAVLEDGISRGLNKESKQLQTAIKKGNLEQWRSEFYPEFDEYLVTCVGRAAEAYLAQAVFMARSYHGTQTEVDAARLAGKVVLDWAADYANTAKMEPLHTPQQRSDRIKKLENGLALNLAEDLFLKLERSLLDQIKESQNNITVNVEPIKTVVQLEEKREVMSRKMTVRRDKDGNIEAEFLPAATKKALLKRNSSGELEVEEIREKQNGLV